MSIGAVRAGEAFVELTTRDSNLRKGLQNAEIRLKAFAVASSEIGRDILAFTTASAATIALSFRIFKNFDTQMRMVKAVTQATGKEFEMLSRRAREIGAATSFTAQEVALAMTALGRMGLRPREIDEAIDSVMNLSRATGTDLAEAADIAANSLRIFGLQANQMSMVADFLTATANGSAQTLTDLFEALKIVGPQARIAGETIADTAAALGVMANMGIKGSLAGTALRKAYLQFADPKIQNFLRDYNVATVTATGNLRKMRDIMIDLTRAMSTMGSAEKLAFAKQVFDLRGMTGGLVITADTAALDEFIEKLSNCQDIAKKTREEMESGAGGAWDKLLSALQETGISIGAIISKALIPLLNCLTSVLVKVNEWIQENSALISVLGGVVAALLVIGTTLVTVGVSIKAFTAICAFAKIGLAAFTVATTAGTSALTTFGIALKAFLATNPAGWALLAASAIATLVVAFSDFSDVIDDTNNKLADLYEQRQKERTIDYDKALRLKNLSEKQHLNNAEMVEARRLTTDLEQKYGSLGIVFNETAKSIGNMADALEQLQRLQRAFELEDIKNAIAEKQKNIGIAQGYNDEMRPWSFKSVMSLGLIHVPLFGGKSEAEEVITTNNAYIAERNKEIERLQARQRILERPMPQHYQPGKEGSIDSDLITFQEFLEAQEKVVAIEKKMHAENLSPLEKEIKAAETANANYKDLLNTMLRYKKNKETLLKKNNAPEAERAQLAAEIEQLQRKIAFADQYIAKQRELITGRYREKDSTDYKELSDRAAGIAKTWVRDSSLAKELAEVNQALTEYKKILAQMQDFQKKRRAQTNDPVETAIIDSELATINRRIVAAETLAENQRQRIHVKFNKKRLEEEREFLAQRAQLSDLENQLLRKELTPLQKELKEIDSLNESYKNLLKTMMRIREERLSDSTISPKETMRIKKQIAELREKLANADMLAGKAAKAAETMHKEREKKERDAETMHKEREKKERDVEKHRVLGEITADVGVLVAFDKSQAQEAFQKKLEKEISNLFEIDPNAGRRSIQNIMSMYQGAAAAARREHARLVADARIPDQDDVIRYTNVERKNIAAAFEKIRNATEMFDFWRSQLAERRDAVAEKTQSSATGSWVAKHLRSMLGGDRTAADRTAVATEKQNRLTEKTNKKIDHLLHAMQQTEITYGE
ncbi:MAG: phage tail tape measure protein [Lentisphaerae bacterium]|nr:phage tail tape measure protein [Lentisphaerota bacterium]